MPSNSTRIGSGVMIF